MPANTQVPGPSPTGCRFNRRTLPPFAAAALLVVGLAAAGCDRTDSDGDQSEPTAESADQSSRADKASDREEVSDESGTDDGKPGGWRRVEADDLDASGREMLDRARSAQKALGSTLKKELTTAVSEKSFSGAVEFCHSRAPEIAEEVADNQEVAIGRTSHRLRNSDNTPPKWAEAAVERKEARQYVYRGPDDELGYLGPIKAQGLCLNCHGKKDDLADGVVDKLDEHYPDDQATGFEAGDLRGWFWVEVPGGES